MYMTIQPDALQLLGVVIAKGYVEPLEFSEEEQKLLGGVEEVYRNYNVSQNMRKYRLERGMTQKVFSKKLGVSQAFLSYFEKRNKIVPVRLYPHIAKELGVTVEELLKEE